MSEMCSPGKNKTVLFTGATGALGPRIVWAFHEAGYQIKILSTEPVERIQEGLLPGNVEIVIVNHQVAVSCH